MQGELAGHIGAGHGLCRRNPALNCALAVGQFVHLVDERATSALKTALTDLAGNLIRVVRGAGKADRIANQVNAFEDAFIGTGMPPGAVPTVWCSANYFSFKNRMQFVMITSSKKS